MHILEYIHVYISHTPRPPLLYLAVHTKIQFLNLSPNPVERRRRDRINELIKVLAQVVPGCQKKDATTGNVVGVSKTLCHPQSAESAVLLKLLMSTRYAVIIMYKLSQQSVAGNFHIL